MHFGCNLASEILKSKVLKNMVCYRIWNSYQYHVIYEILTDIATCVISGKTVFGRGNWAFTTILSLVCPSKRTLGFRKCCVTKLVFADRIGYEICYFYSILVFPCDRRFLDSGNLCFVRKLVFCEPLLLLSSLGFSL